jgi:hypothetical protein
MKKTKGPSPFLIPSLLAVLVFISSNQQFFFVADDIDSDAGNAKIKTQVKNLNYDGPIVALCIPNQDRSAPILAVIGNVPVSARASTRGNIPRNIKEHSPPIDIG